jgi:hypothetical protein
VCAISEASCSVFNGHYIESNNCSDSDEEKGRRALTTCVSHLKKRETHSKYACLAYEEVKSFMLRN